MKINNKEDLEKLTLKLNSLGYKDNEIFYIWDKNTFNMLWDASLRPKNVNKDLDSNIKVIVGNANFNHSSTLVNSNVELIIGDVTIYSIDCQPEYKNLKCITGVTSILSTGNNIALCATHQYKLSKYHSKFDLFINKLKEEKEHNKSTGFTKLLNKLIDYG